MAVQPGCGQSGMASELEEGLDWVLDRHMAQPEPRKPAVVSMSLLVQVRFTSAEQVHSANFKLPIALCAMSGTL